MITLFKKYSFKEYDDRPRAWPAGTRSSPPGGLFDSWSGQVHPLADPGPGFPLREAAMFSTLDPNTKGEYWYIKICEICEIYEIFEIYVMYEISEICEVC